MNDMFSKIQIRIKNLKELDVNFILRNPFKAKFGNYGPEISYRKPFITPLPFDYF